MKNSIIILILTLLSAAQCSAQVITTIAGTGIDSTYGDGGPAIAAGIGQDEGVAVDLAGNVYISDGAFNRIRKINTSGVISTLAGNGTPGFSGDGGPATSAEIDEPAAIKVDDSGNVYFVDQGNVRIREVNTHGTIFTFAGAGFVGYYGDGGPATEAAFSGSLDIAFDRSGNLYIADEDNNRVRKVSGGIITTFAGIGGRGADSGDGGSATAAELGGPIAVTVDSVGNVYISEGIRIREVTTDGSIHTIAGTGGLGYSGDGGPATAATFNGIAGLAVNKLGYLYLSDQFNNVIRNISPSGIVNTIAGDGLNGFSGDGGPAILAELDEPWGIAVNSESNIFIADMNNHVIRELSAPTSIETLNASPGEINIFPNPVMGADLLQLNTVLSPAAYQLRTMVGTVVFQGTLATGNNSLSLSGLPPAPYIMEITGSDGLRTTTKIIKQ